MLLPSPLPGVILEPLIGNHLGPDATRVHEPFSREGSPLARIGETLTPVGNVITLVSHAVPVIGHAFATRGDEVTTVRQPCPFIDIGDRLNSVGGQPSLGGGCPLGSLRRDSTCAPLRSQQLRLGSFNRRLSPLDRSQRLRVIGNLVKTPDGPTLRLAIQRPLLFVSQSFTLIGKPLTLIGEPLALIRQPLTLVRGGLPKIRPPILFLGWPVVRCR